jgi:pyruvate/2-oxoglutarate dehydrogenase complex dihydrolipoamide acyltransferase (E2) component
MRALLAFFTGLGIVLVAIVGGLGSGLLLANMGPHAPKPTNMAAAPAAKPQEKPKPQDKPKQSSALASRDPAANGEQAFAKARATDLKRMAQKRRPERRQRWADRHRYQPRDDQQQDQRQDIERSARQDTERSASNEAVPRDVAEQPMRAFTEPPARIEFPPIRLFGPPEDDDGQ